MSPAAGRLVFWSPRILCIAFAIFLSLFATDAYHENSGLWQVAVALFMHLIPVMALVAALAVAWRWEWVGAVVFAAAAGLYASRVLPAHPSWAAAIALPLLVIAALFLANWVKRTDLRVAH